MPNLTTFPLERPLLRQRMRDAKLARQRASASLPLFIAGPENRLAAFVCQSDAAFSLAQPVLMIGPSGCGKTALALHLAARCAASMSLGGQSGAVKYLVGSDYARDYAEAVAADDLPPLREMIDEVPVLVLDGLHAMAGKRAAQDELSMRLERRVDAGRPTILTSQRLPSETRGIRPQLASRSVIGLTIPIQFPGPESRRTLLREYALLRGVELSEDLIGLLDAGLRTELPALALDAAIKQVDLFGRMNETTPNVAAVQSAIDTAGRNDDVDLGKITRTVAKIWGHRTKDLRSGSRKQSVVRARSLAMMLARQLTSHSLDTIGEYFGGRDHSTVLHAIRKTQSLLEHDGDLSRMMQEATEKLAV
ncbi:AAA family ATPase [Roseiconus nitratireducens]|uniref:Chromosomal replication initiator protein DnaA n=1 Tax=Roseiconus nitratireducens TaxID=2605748 RepID=A0A5M6CU28_9BACT|nr:helix-turn-helix domain-containing protein [Roseiconus nitratireducens]KAA5538767.1 AAA family ATPase [Roseiconus nitratireducens]